MPSYAGGRAPIEIVAGIYANANANAGRSGCDLPKLILVLVEVNAKGGRFSPNMTGDFPRMGNFRQ
jgi:hypothetical protein